ncbi:MAG: hypothetical protein ACFFDW_13515, partial [Candidatus Thorarchaeota archaeon]
MNDLMLAFLAILVPFIGAFLSLLFSQLEDYVAGEGKTQSWLIFFLVLIPTVIITLLLVPNLHIDRIAFVHWLPGFLYGIRVDELSKLFAIFIAIASAIIGLFSISYMSEDSSKTSFWFFFLMVQSGMMLGIFANNIYWMFLGFEVASISGFFLISHFHRKSGEEGLKAGKAGIRFFIFNFIGDIFLIV